MLTSLSSFETLSFISSFLDSLTSFGLVKSMQRKPSKKNINNWVLLLVIETKLPFLGEKILSISLRCLNGNSEFNIDRYMNTPNKANHNDN